MKMFKYPSSFFYTSLKALTALAIGSFCLTMPSPVFAKERGTKCQVHEGPEDVVLPPASEKFLIVWGKVTPYGGGNASITDVTIENPPSIFRRINMIAPYRINYGAGDYTLIAANGNTIVFGFDSRTLSGRAGAHVADTFGQNTLAQYTKRRFKGPLYGYQLEIWCWIRT